ncbi:hypothetical protein BH09GEM1_BH09GEM1_18970 [soil metagenome]
MIEGAVPRKWKNQDVSSFAYHAAPMPARLRCAAVDRFGRGAGSVTGIDGTTSTAHGAAHVTSRVVLPSGKRPRGTTAT